MEYQTLTTADQVAIARDTLRAQETDHRRLSLMAEAGLPGAQQERVDEMERGIQKLRAAVTDLESRESSASQEQSTEDPVVTGCTKEASDV